MTQAAVNADPVMPPAAAGTFYSDDPGKLGADLNGFLEKPAPPGFAPKAVIAPHAGYIYSGAVAGQAYATLAGQDIRRVALLGPAHRVAFRGIAVPPVAGFRTPLGVVRVDREAIARLAQIPGVVVSSEPFLPEHSVDVHMPFLRVAFGDRAQVVPILVGDADAALIDEAMDAVWGGAETRIIVSSDLSHFHDYDTARQIDSVTTQAVETLRADIITGQHMCGCQPVNALLQRARRLNMRATAIRTCNSGDTAGGKNRVVGYGAYVFEPGGDARLSSEHREMLKDAARQAIAHGMRHGKPPGVDLAAAPPQLRATRNSFVTITTGGNLRGCIGSVKPVQPLLIDVVTNACKAAFNDPRFPALTPEELETIDVKLSVLASMRGVPATSEKEVLDSLQPERDGLMLLHGPTPNGNGGQAMKSGIFLPDVWSSIPTPHDFLRALKQKAGLPPKLWPDSIRAYRYTAEAF